MFDDSVIKECTKLANRASVEPAAFLAIVEVESRGQPFEADGKTPRFLFERHKFYENLSKRMPQKLAAAVGRGLAIPNWDRKNQYRDLGTSKSRMAVLAQAVEIDKECAYRSCSWGVGQVMGSNANSLGYASAVEMVRYMSTLGIPAQADVMFKFIQVNKLIGYVRKRDWTNFALKYNGPGYKQNQYDTKMAAAYTKWTRALDPNDLETGAEEIDIPPTTVPEPPKEDILKTSTFWATLASMLAALGSAFSNPYVQIFLLCIVVAGGIYVIYERRKKQTEALI